MKRALSLALFCALNLSVVQAQENKETTVTNQVKGGIEGVNNDTFRGGDGSGSALVRLKVIQLQLHKASYGLTEKGEMEREPLKQDAKVVLGQTLFFTLFVDNLTDAHLHDLHMLDNLDETAFEYIPGTIEMALTEANQAAQNGDFKTQLSDTEDNDIASMIEGNTDIVGRDMLTVGRVDEKNGLLSVAPGKRLTIRFKVQVL